MKHPIYTNLSKVVEHDSNLVTMRGLSGGWQQAITLVRSNSASWEESADILPTVTNYLSTSNVAISSLRISNKLTIFGSISGKNITTSFNEGSASGDYSFAEGSGITGIHSSWGHAEGELTASTGGAAHAEGGHTQASGDYSHAEGLLSIAFGYCSHAEGEGCNAVGDHTHVEGIGSLADAVGSHAENAAQARGPFSHAEGSAITYGNTSHAEGFGTTYGNSSHAEGMGTVAKGNISHAAGIKATAAQDYTYAWSDGNLNTITKNVSTTRSGQYMVSASGGVFVPGKVGIGVDCFSEGLSSNALTVVGNISGNNPSASFNLGWSVGNYSFAVGTGKSFGNYSHAEGLDTMASGQGSHAEGRYTTASEESSHAEGYSTAASGVRSHAEGSQTIASGGISHAEGAATNAKGNVSHAAGYRATAAHDLTYAWSDGNLATTTANISTTRSGQYMVSASGGMFIPGNVGIGVDCFNEGLSSNALTVVGDISASNAIFVSNIDSLGVLKISGGVAEGYQTHAVSWNPSHAEGDRTAAIGNASHAEGSYTQAVSDCSHAEGYSTTAGGERVPFETWWPFWFDPDPEVPGVANGVFTFSAENSAKFDYLGTAEGTKLAGFASGYPGAFAINIAKRDTTTGTISAYNLFYGDAIIAGLRYLVKPTQAYSHAEGCETIASGLASHAAGFKATAAQDYTYAWSDGNLGTATTNLSTTRSGQYMVSASGGMFIPGNVGIGVDCFNPGLSSNKLTVGGVISATSITVNGTLSAADLDLTNATVATPSSVTDTGEFLILKINGAYKGIRLWDVSEPFLWNDLQSWNDNSIWSE